MKKGEFGRKLGLVSHLQEFKYNVGDIINNKIILENYIQDIPKEYKTRQKKRKACKYKCLICGHVDDVIERGILWKCPICYGNKTDENINSVQVLYPNVYKNLINKEDGKLSIHTKKRVLWKCPYCMSINKHGIRYLCKSDTNICGTCGEGVSFPEKVLNAVFEQISKTYKRRVRFQWSNNREYDFYDCGIFTEIHGEQHKNGSFESCGGRTIEEERENDNYKYNLAKNNDSKYVDYIVIWADKSSFEYIKNNIISSKLNKYYDLSKVDWSLVKKKCNSSFLQDICNLFNTGYSFDEIAIKMKCSGTTVRKYVKLGNELNLCNYIHRKNQYA